MMRLSAPVPIQCMITTVMCLSLAYLAYFGPAKVSATEAHDLARTYYTSLKEEDWPTIYGLFQPNAAISVRADYGVTAPRDGYETNASDWADVAASSGGGWGYSAPDSGLAESNWNYELALVSDSPDGTRIRIDHSSDYTFQGYEGQATGYEVLTLARYYGRPIIVALKSSKNFGE
ncbi:hypothetical protein [uncultured Roseovarius sp.]|uniref:hypothetical protein n=1 Tax=uncultured Roseovarius sp. TaxID=293344 RepID=UPI002626D67C|nr:hypothetical protein [uncultured Roseovarius sp.]